MSTSLRYLFWKLSQWRFSQITSADLARMYLVIVGLFYLLAFLKGIPFERMAMAYSFIGPIMVFLWSLHVVTLRIIFKSGPSSNKWLRMLGPSGKATDADLLKGVGYTLGMIALVNAPFYAQYLGLTDAQLGVIFMIITAPIAALLFLYKPAIKAARRQFG